MTCWSVRRAVQAETDALVAIESEAFGDRSWGADGLAGGFDAPGVEILAASKDDGAVRGFAIWRLAAGEAELLNIGVAEKERGSGAGSALLRMVIDRAREGGADAVFLDVDPANAAALRLYRRQGFAEVARRKAYYRTGADALIMRKGL